MLWSKENALCNHHLFFHFPETLSPPNFSKQARADSSPDPSSARTKSKNKLVSVLRKSISPENSFRKTESALKPHALPEYLEGRTPKEKHPFLFQKKFHPRQIRNAR